MTAPVEKKVQASTAAAAAAGLALWVLGRYVFKGSVPDVVASWIYVIVPSAVTFAAGYFARHTPRPVTPPPTGQIPGGVLLPPMPAPPEKTLTPPAAPE